MNEEQVRKALTETLHVEPENYNKILELSSKLASFDRTNIRFTVDAGVIDRLGKELVARHETAVSELVKNAYDADATNVELLFENADRPGGTLTVEDNGHGMTKKQIVNGFMRISSSDKIHNPTSPVYNRSRAGKKGIGRFATQRLGEKLTIVTQTEDATTAYKIEIYWKAFNTDSDLITISNSITEIEKSKSHGTTLIIENLREAWSITSIKRVYKYSLDVIQPFPLSKVDDKSSSDPGFLVRCFQGLDENLEEVADEESMIFDHSLAEIEGNINSEGLGEWKVISKKLNLEDSGKVGKDKKIDTTKFDFLKNVHFKAYYFIYNIGMIPRLIEGAIREKANEVGGIRMYRNGFRVLPYGEPKDDWLGLDESVRRRVILPAHGRNNFFGFVEINDAKGDIFNELSSREGLFQNPALSELSDFVYRSIIAAVLRIAEAREKKRSTGQKDWVKEENLSSETVKSIADELDDIAQNLSETNSKNDTGNNETGTESNNNDTKRENDEKSRRFKELSDKLRSAADSIEEIGMLRVLAGLGLTIGEFTHEIKQYLPAFDVDSDYLINNLDPVTEEYKRALRLKNSFASFSAYASYFDKTISQNVQRQLIPIELRDAVNSFVNVISPDISRNNFQVLTSFQGYDLFTCRMHPSEWASILFNLYTNAKKAIKRKQSQGQILINAGIIDNKVYLEFHDNGDGIPKENEEKIFRPFFTTSNISGHSATKEEELVGTGLGLKIIKDIVESHSGEIYLQSPAVNYSTNFRIELPKASEEEIAQYDL